MSLRPGSKTAIRVWAINREQGRSRPDHLATEEPMEIRLVAQGIRRTVAVTMRTPGNDFELAAGFLHGEGVIAGRDDVARISYCVDPGVDATQQYNIVNVALRRDAAPDLAPLERHFYTTSSCGVCGKASLEALQVRNCPVIPAGPAVPVEVLYALPGKLQHAQGVFQQTGGLHAAALFDASGELLASREDVGRHNAVDKLVGWALMSGMLPLSRCILMVSGRTSFEILQKSLAAGIPIVCAVSAPSSLAVDLAREFGITLVGFLRGERCNVYTSRERILTRSEERETSKEERGEPGANQKPEQPV
jgi:FdhD protein